MAKRSPILGYNHNVRYRGLVFHVQTEDSGVMSPHLFTHLFFEGVIVSTRKLVYDASASEDAIKSLMQAQHKAVLKELNKHTFDDKIDAYLGGTPGLEPRESAPALVTPRPSDPEITVEPGVSEPLLDRATTDPSKPSELAPSVEPPIVPQLVQPVVPEPQPRAKRKSAGPPLKPDVPEPAAKARTQTAERTSRASQFRSMPPPPPPQEDPAPLLDNGTVGAEILAAATIPTASPPTRPTPPPPPTPRPAPMRAATPPPIPAAARSKKGSIPLTPDSSPEIEIIQHEEHSNRSRTTRDTAVDHNFEQAIPSAIGPDATVPSDGVPGRIGDSIPQLPPVPGRSTTPSRPPSHNAATLPPMRQPSRPAITPASVVSRPLPPDQRHRDNTDAIEVYAPAPPSVEPPPGERSERPGQYSMSRRAKDGEVPMREHTGRVAIPAGLGRPRGPNQSQPMRTPTSSSPPSSIVPESMRGVPQPVRPEPTPSHERISERTRAASSQSDGVPRSKTTPPESVSPPAESKATTPTRAPHLTAPMASRTGTGSGQSGSTSGPNVVMTRPAVIVGAPPKLPGSPAPQRVRKAREDEGRGFGQGLISEKSLDEVILAYLSEDADEK